MATKQSIQYIDDLTGKEIALDDVQHLTIGVDGNWYKLDLSQASYDKVMSSLGTWTKDAEKVDPPMRRRRVNTNASTSNREHLNAIREWATANGHQVSARGRIAQNVIDAFEQAHNGTPATEESKPKAKTTTKPKAEPKSDDTTNTGPDFSDATKETATTTA